MAIGKSCLDDFLRLLREESHEREDGMRKMTKVKESKKVSVSIQELDKKRYAVLLRGCELGLRDLGIKVNFSEPIEENGYISFTVSSAGRIRTANDKAQLLTK